MEKEYKIFADKTSNVEGLSAVAEIYLRLAESAYQMAYKYQQSGSGYDFTKGPLTMECTFQRNKETSGIDIIEWNWKSFGLGWHLKSFDNKEKE